MIHQAHVYLFGDQTYETNARLRALLFLKDDPILQSFLEQACYVIRAEVGQLPLRERRSFPHFTSIAELLARQKEGSLSPAFQTALSCVYQLGCFFRQHGKCGRAYPLPSETYLLGLCTGALAAAAIGSCKTLSELLPVAVQTVVVAFRLGLFVVNVGDRIEAGSSSSWSLIIPGLTPSAASVALKEFSKNLPPTSRPWISANIVNGTSISGPPSILDALRKTPSFAKFHAMEIPIRVPGHASHLFTTDDVNALLETTSDTPWASYTSKIPIVSSATGKLMFAGNFRSLLHTALKDILMEPLRWDSINEEFSLILRSSGASQIKLIPIATNAEQTIISGLKNAAPNGGQSTLSRPHSSYGPSAEDLITPAIEIDYQKEMGGAEFPVNMSGNPNRSKLAIVGMSGRFPDAESPEEFWKILHQGLDVAREVPIKRWDVKTHVDLTGRQKNTGATPWGCFIKNPGLFDARFFSISPKEAPQVDPAQRISLMTTYEAMEEAGIVPGTTPSTQTDRIGVFHGVTSNDYMETNTSQKIDTHFITGGNRAFIPGRINYCFEFCGPSYSVDTACSSSLAAMHLACNSLWRGDTDTAIAGGTNMINNPDGHAGLDRGFFLSRTGNCKTFDDGADGYCRGEGIVTVIIKRLEDAIADNDPIRAIILGTNTNHSAESDSITRPHAGAQKVVFDKVLTATGTDPYDLSYIEMHGTGTQVGDAIEMESVLGVFAPKATPQSRRGKDEALYLGAAKANIGHGEGVSGVTSLAKVLLMMQKNIIPPHCGIKTKINHTYPLDFKERNVHIALKPTPWIRAEGKSRKVLINNFSAAGGNTALLLEDAPVQTLSPDHVEDPRSSHLVAVSAKCAASLKGNLQSLRTYLNGPHDQDFSLPRLSYTTTARRLHHQHRVIISGTDIHEIKSRLEQAIARGDGMTRIKSAPKIVFAFTGQGSQYLGMGKQLFETVSLFRSHIRRFDQLAQVQGFPSFHHVFTADDGAIGEFTPQVVQLAMCCMQMALARLWISWGISPDATVGHSLGEYAALNVSGVLTDADTIYLVGKRAELLQEHCRQGTHAMLAVKSSNAEIQRLLVGQKYEIACVNGPEDTVLGGSVDQINTLQDVIAAHHMKSTILQVPFAFHTSQVFPVLGDFEDAARGVTYHKPSIPVVCPLLSNVVTEAGVFGPKYLVRHCREAVNMYGALRSAREMRVITDKSFVIEIGPHPVISGMVKATLGPQVTILPTLQRNKDVWTILSAALSALYSASHDIRWLDYHRDFKSSQKVLQLPAYSWDMKEYWIPYDNDWCILKGEAVPGSITRAVLPRLESTTMHKLVEETTDHQGGTYVIESDISRPDLNSIAQGHKVNQVPLCTPSVYADIALTLGTYLLDRFKPKLKERIIVDVADLVAEKALVPHSNGPQILRTSAKVDWRTMKADCKFDSVDQNGRTIVEHGWCTVRFKDRSQLLELEKDASKYLSRIEDLRKGIASGSSLRLNQIAGYKMISSLAQFHPDYRAIDEVVLDSDTLEATSVCSFGQVKSGGIFHTHPAYIDCMTQTAGFVMNGKDSTDLEVEVFVNHGWKSLQIYAEISPKKTYQSYVQMFKGEGDMWEGDTILFDGSNVVAYFKGVALRAVPRKLFHMVLAAADTTKSQRNRSQQPNKGVSAPAPKNVVPGPTASMLKSASLLVPVIEQPKPVELPPLAPMQSSLGNNEKFESALQVISEETGIALDDLSDDSTFADIGVDSLLSMVICSRFREELNLDLDLEFSLFLDLPTVKNLRDFLGPYQDAVPARTHQTEPTSRVEATITGQVEAILVNNTEDPPTISVGGNIQIALTGTSTDVFGSTGDMFGPSLNIIAEESGISVDDLTDDTSFADIGVDSLLSMVISSRFREELGLDLDLEFSLFLDLPTVKDLRLFLVKGSDEQTLMLNEDPHSTDEWASSTSSIADRQVSSSEARSLTDESELPTPLTPFEEVKLEEGKPRESCYCRPATSVILQRFPETASKTLFLFPDGGGSSSSYDPVPRLKIDVAVIGLNCPYARDPENMLCNIEDLMDSYMTEIRRRQPHGPYHLGGWSSGGIFAYMATQRFLNAGEEVPSLIIIDSPVPRLMDKLPRHFYEYCEKIGLFGYTMGANTDTIPPWLIPHFHATVDVLHGHYTEPLRKEDRMPKVSIIWACNSVMEDESVNLSAPEPEDSQGMHFLVEKRKDFGPNGWEEMLPEAEFLMDKVVGANHFSMMQKPHIAQIGRFIERGVA